MSTLELYEKIEDYLKNRLSPPDRAAFESDIQTNPDLAAEVALHRDIMEAEQEKDIHAFRKMMEGIAAETAVEVEEKAPHAAGANTAGKPKIIRLGWIAGAIAATLFLAWFIWNEQSMVPLSSEELFAENFEAPKRLTLAGNRIAGSEETPGEETASSRYLNQADSFYMLKQYDVALNYLKQAEIVADNATLMSEIHRNRGIVLLAMGNGAAAEQAFQGITEGFTEDKAWYTALSLLLQENKKEEARAAFQVFAAGSDQYSAVRQKRAQAILHQLE